MEQNNKKTWLIVAVLAILVIVLAVLMSNRKGTAPMGDDLSQLEAPISLYEGEYTDLDRANFEVFLTENLSEISPEKEVLGGTFYITNLNWADNRSGTVDYEDGHIALRANFSFSYADAEGTVPQVDYFTLIPLEVVEEEVMIEEPVVEEEMTEEVVEEVTEEVLE